jgi:hypothetical protein
MNPVLILIWIRIRIHTRNEWFRIHNTDEAKSRVPDWGIKPTLSQGYGRLWHRVSHGKCVGSRRWSGHTVGEVKVNSGIGSHTMFFGILVNSSVAVPEPDPYVFGPLGSGSSSMRYGTRSSSGSLKIKQEKIM